MEERQREINRVELELEAAITKQTNFDTQVETLFTGQADARETFNQRQKRNPNRNRPEVFVCRGDLESSAPADHLLRSRTLLGTWVRWHRL